MMRLRDSKKILMQGVAITAMVFQAAQVWTPTTELTRSTYTLGTDKPTTALVGTLPGWTADSTKTRTTNLFIDAPVTYEGWLFQGRVVVRSKNVIFRNCRFEGPATAQTSDDGLVNTDHANLAGATASERVLFEDCTFVQRDLGNRTNGILGWQFTARRCDFSRVVDGIGVHGYNWWNANGRPADYDSGVTIEFCYMHDGYFAAASYQSDGYTHNDMGIQVQGGSRGVFRGNWVRAYRDPAVGNQSDIVGSGGNASYIGGRVLSCVLFNDNVGIPNGWVIDQNWFEGGHLAVYITDAITTLTVTGNRFDGTASGRDIDTNQTAANRPNVNISGNTRYDTSQSVNIRRG